jgi:hypothetical protein
MRVFAIAAAVAGLAFAGVALASAGQPKHDFKPAEQALAKSIILKPSDLPAGFKATPAKPSSGDTPHCKGFNPDNSALTLRGEATSPDFNGPQSGLPLISSNAAVFLSAAQAQTAYSSVARQGLLNCLVAQIQSSASKTTKFVPVSQKLAPLGGFGQQAAIARIVQNVVQGKTKTPFVLDLVIIRKGRVIVLFTAVALQQPYSGETALVTKLTSRMP